MLYHAHALASDLADVDVIGYADSDIHPAIRDHAHIRWHRLRPVSRGRRLDAPRIVFLLGAVHGPRAGGRWVYGVLAALASSGGAAIAGRHVWLQSLPPDQVPACGPTLDYLLGMLPVMEVITMVLKGDGNCAKIDAAWLGISLPGWTLIAFVGFVFYALAIPAIARITERRSSTIGS